MNDYTQIPNELMEIIYSDALNRSESRVLAYMARKIYGYHKSEDAISNSQIALKLGISKKTVIESLKRLSKVGITILVRQGTTKKKPNVWRLDYTNYVTKLVGIGSLVKYDAQKLVGITSHTKETITKESSAAAISETLSSTGTIQRQEVSTAVGKNIPTVVEELILLIGKEFMRYEGGKTYRKTKNGWDHIKNPSAYLKSVKENSTPVQNSTPLIDGANFHYPTAEEWEAKKS